MRELTINEIENVSGAGWFQDIGEFIANLFNTIFGGASGFFGGYQAVAGEGSSLMRDTATGIGTLIGGAAAGQGGGVVGGVVGGQFFDAEVHLANQVQASGGMYADWHNGVGYITDTRTTLP